MGYGIAYDEFVAQDSQDYNIMQHFDVMASLSDDAKKSGGILFIHCEAGVNRSGTLCLAYHIKSTGTPMLESAYHCKKQRGRICTNQSFQVQLAKFVFQNGLPCR